MSRKTKGGVGSKGNPTGKDRKYYWGQERGKAGVVTKKEGVRTKVGKQEAGREVT